MAAQHGITAGQGETFHLNFTIKTDGAGWNLSDYTVRMQVRQDFNVSTKLLDLSSTTGDITKNSVGEVSVTASASAMSALPAGRWVYDLEFESSGGEVTRILEGHFLVTSEVTQ